MKQNAFDPYNALKSFTYVCKEGERIEDICKRYNASVSKVMEMNGISGDVLPGDVIYIERSEGELYRVVVGDDLKAIACRFGKEEGEILFENNCTEIYPGQILFIYTRVNT